MEMNVLHQLLISNEIFHFHKVHWGMTQVGKS